jgi:HK97 family phage portal protein
MASDREISDLLLYQPNNYQTPSQFKAQMQAWALMEGDAHAMIAWSRGRPVALYPLQPRRLRVRQAYDFSLHYTYSRPDGSTIELEQKDVFRLSGLSLDGVMGVSRTRVAREAIGLAMRTEEAAGRLFRNGALIGGWLEHPNQLGPDAFNRIKAQVEEKSGAENAGKTMILEEGMKWHEAQGTAKDNEHVPQRKLQIEEILRAFGVPRPLAMIDDTAWGSGIEQLAILFVRFGLSHWFRAWEEAAAISFLTREERRSFYFDFDEQELLRGTMKDLGEFLARMTGAGGAAMIMTQNNAREVVGLPPHVDGDSLKNPMTQRGNAGAIDEPPKTP